MSVSRAACTPSGLGFRELRGHLLRGLAHLILRHEAVDEPDRVGFLAGDALARQEQPLARFWCPTTRGSVTVMPKPG